MDMIDLLSDMYNMGISPAFPLPPHLFLDIVRINNLRANGADPDSAQGRGKELSAEAHRLLEHVVAFSPEQWADSNSPTFRHEWLLLARILHSSVTLYCLSSLESIALLSPTPQLEIQRAAHRDRLMVYLDEAIPSRLLKKSLLWPLIVAGVEAAGSSNTEQRLIARRLEQQSRDLGTQLPLVAKEVLERFWAGGSKRWDDCFDRPYAFLL